MPVIGETLRPHTRAAWRAWLDRHPGAREIWLLLAKKHVPGRWLTHDETVEAAPCVGWIDGIVRRVDEDFRALRCTPRRWGRGCSERGPRVLAPKAPTACPACGHRGGGALHGR